MHRLQKRQAILATFVIKDKYSSVLEKGEEIQKLKGSLEEKGKQLAEKTKTVDELSSKLAKELDELSQKL
uniref:Uncharacterized protein n=1 Tax=Amphimedon queenslandica TaxID=400682 RepID=A0A1X7SYG3_AMPQE